MPRFHADVDFLLDEVATVTKNATVVGAWHKVTVGEAFNFWWYMTASGAPSVTISIDYTLFDPTRYDGKTHDPDSATRANYRTVQLGTGLMTKATWTHIDTPSELLYPFVAWRARVVEADVAAATTFSLAVCRNVAG